jgi:hypothetical protein
MLPAFIFANNDGRLEAAAVAPPKAGETASGASSNIQHPAPK